MRSYIPHKACNSRPGPGETGKPFSLTGNTVHKTPTNTISWLGNTWCTWTIEAFFLKDNSIITATCAGNGMLSIDSTWTSPWGTNSYPNRIGTAPIQHTPHGADATSFYALEFLIATTLALVESSAHVTWATRSARSWVELYAAA